MIGILGAAGYVPKYRLSGKIVAEQWGGAGRGERAVANHDEDAITMAGEAVRYCVQSARDGQGCADGLIFASVSSPYAEKHASAFLATVADLKSEVYTMDIGGGPRAGTSAIKVALDMVKAGSVKSILVAAADLRLAEPSDPMEMQLGDGAAAVLVGEGEPIAEFLGFTSTMREFTDVWRMADERFLNSADAKFILDKGYMVFMAEAAKALLAKKDIKAEDIAHVAFYSPNARNLKGIAKSIGIGPEKVVSVTGSIGDTGCAQPLLNMVMALEKAKPGELILVLGHGSGADAFLLRATDKIKDFKAEKSIEAQLKSSLEISSYGKFLKYRGIIEGEKLSPWSSLPVLWREEKENWRLIGKKCNKCGAIQYPVRRICWKCSAKDDFSDYKISTRGKVFTFTRDHLVPTPDPPVAMVTVDLEDGGRFYAQMTDCNPADVAIGMEVELTLRKMHEGGNYVNYFWKLRPV